MGAAKKVTVIGLSSVVLVAVVVAVAVGVNKNNQSSGGGGDSGGGVSTSNKAVKAMCNNVDYKQSCEDSLSSTNSTDPKELIKVGFDVAISDLKSAIGNSTTLKEAAKDPRTSDAYDICKHLLETAVDDLHRSFDKVGAFDISKLDDYVADLKTWLTGTLTYQETCIDAFQNTSGDNGEKMKKLLQTSSELSSNALAMVDELASMLSSLQIPEVNRRLLSHEDEENNKRSLFRMGSPEDGGWGMTKPDSADENNKRSLFRMGSPEDGGWGMAKPDSVDENNKRSLFRMGSPEDGGWGMAKPDSADENNKRSLFRMGSPEDGGWGWAKTDSADDNKKRSLFSTTSPEDNPGWGWAKTDSADDSGRRLGEDDPENSPIPGWVDGTQRHLLQAPPKPNAVVPDQFKTISDAVKAAPPKSPTPFVIFIKAGIYKEYVDVPRHVDNVVFIGEGQLKTRITGNKNFIDGVATFKTSTVSINGDGFIAKDIGFENSAGAEKHQAVALRVSGDRAVFFRCQMDGFQDTLYTHAYRQFYRDCTISGTIDFIFGDASAVLQNCKMIVRKPMANQGCMVTAQGRKEHRATSGLVLQNCYITAEPAFMETKPPIQSFLGRPWKEFSRTIIMQSFIDSNIVPEGWSPWTGTFGQDTCFYAEYLNRGPGSDVSRRVAWKGIKKISPQEADGFTASKFIQGDTWVRAAGVPYDPGMMKV